ncbi:MAG: hypothetical protein GY772_06485 [bacterium]|nr:hypothetical protein [bacterium]
MTRIGARATAVAAARPGRASSLRLATWNCATLEGRFQEAVDFMHDLDLHVLLLQEVRVRVHSAPSFVRLAARTDLRLDFGPMCLDPLGHATGGLACMTRLPYLHAHFGICCGVVVCV